MQRISFPKTGLILGLPQTELYSGKAASSHMTQQFNLSLQQPKEDSECC